MIVGGIAASRGTAKWLIWVRGGFSSPASAWLLCQRSGLATTTPVVEAILRRGAEMLSPPRKGNKSWA